MNTDDRKSVTFNAIPMIGSNINKIIQTVAINNNYL